MELTELLITMVQKGASDLHIKVGSPPYFRIHGELISTDFPPLTEEEVKRLLLPLMSEKFKERFEKKGEVDFAYSLSGVGRFRVNFYLQRGSIAASLRHVPTKRPDFAGLNLPPVVKNLAEEPRGLVLVTGTAGSGKTTTLAAMIDHINRTRRCHIVTIEDPIEILFKDEMSIISQRELGIDTETYADALRHVVRQDPDVILIGEMRDHETVRAALSAAEMGNLVLSTLHTIDVTETVNRIIDFFPPHQQRQIRIMLAASLKGVISLRLLPKIGGGRVPAVEAMVVTATIREFILKPEETYKIKDAIEQGEYYGMQTFEQSLVRLIQEQKITLEDAQMMAANPQDFLLRLKQIGIIF